MADSAPEPVDPPQEEEEEEQEVPQETNGDTEDDDKGDSTNGGGGGLTSKSSSRVTRLSSAKSVGMESSILKFKDVNFIVGSKDKEKNILTHVSGLVKFGRVLASKLRKAPRGIGTAAVGRRFGGMRIKHCFTVAITVSHILYNSISHTL